MEAEGAESPRRVAVPGLRVRLLGKAGGLLPCHTAHPKPATAKPSNGSGDHCAASRQSGGSPMPSGGLTLTGPSRRKTQAHLTCAASSIYARSNGLRSARHGT